MSFNSSSRFSRTVLITCLALLSLTACEAVENQLKTDRSGGLEKQDYRDALAPRDIDIDDEESDQSSIPTLKPYISQRQSVQDTMPLVTVSIDRAVPLRSVFYQLSQQSGYDIELDPRITGSIIFTATNRPLDQVVERICDMAGLRYELGNNRLRVEEDTPYNKTYKVGYLNYVRTSNSSIRADLSVVSGDGADAGSSFANTGESESDFWGELEENLALILANASAQNMRTSSDPSVRVVQQNVNVRAVGETDENGNVVVSAPNAVLTVDSIPEEEAQENAESQFVINKQAGLINVFAPQSGQKEVEEYLEKVRRAVTSQVLIEAKILEVELRDNFASGIDWGLLNPLIGGETTFGFRTTATNTVLPSNLNVDPIQDGINGAGFLSPAGFLSNSSTGALAFQYSGNNFESVVRAISQFGNTKALASPRLVVMNNQSAVLTVVRNRVFFEVDVEITPSLVIDGDPITARDSEIRTVPEGVLINVLPSINLDERTVALVLRPTVTSIGNDTVEDPGAPGSEIPQVSVQEIDTVLNVNSGEAVILGGLMQDSTSSNEDGVPILSDIPGLGSLFKTHDDAIQKSELVIFIKATILDNASEAIHNTDRDLYRKFSEDRRPFKM